MGRLGRVWRRTTGGVVAGVVCLVLAGTGAAVALSGAATDKGPASERKGPDSVAFEPQVPFDRARLVVTGPDGFVLERALDPDGDLSIHAQGLTDGTYTYELELARTPPDGAFVELDEEDENGRRRVLTDEARRAGPYSDRVSGSFTVSGGKVVQPAEEPEAER